MTNNDITKKLPTSTSTDTSAGATISGVQKDTEKLKISPVDRRVNGTLQPGEKSTEKETSKSDPSSDDDHLSRKRERDADDEHGERISERGDAAGGPPKKRGRDSDDESEDKKPTLGQPSALSNETPASATEETAPGALQNGSENKSKYTFGSTAGPSAADLGGAAPALPAAKDSNSQSEAPTFGSKFATVSFGSTASAGKSIFGSSSSASPFAALAGSASSNGKSIFGQTASPASFGAGGGADENDGDSNEGDDDDGTTGAGEEQAFGDSSARISLPEQELVTGEEDEVTLFSVRGKLYAMQSGAWKERGAGILKLNAPAEEGPEEGDGEQGDDAQPRRKPRLVMRTDATMRLILNVPLFSGMSMKITQEKFVVFGALDNGKPVSYGFRAPSSVLAADMCEALEKAMTTYL